MAWTNAFDIGACTLSVHKDGSAVAMTAAAMAAEYVTLTADAAGLVTLDAYPISGAGGSYEVRVSPSFDTMGRPVRLTAVADTGIGDAFLTPPEPTWSPAPFPQGPDIVGGSHQFAPDQPWAFAGVAVEYRALAS